MLSIVLAACLVSIALGALAGRQICQRGGDLRRIASLLLMQAAFVNLALMHLAARVLGFMDARMPHLSASSR